MGVIRGLVQFFGFGVQRDLVRKSVGRASVLPVKETFANVGGTWLWSCMVIGDRIFPPLRGRKIFNRIHAAGLLVLVLSLVIPVLLFGRVAHRLVRRRFIQAPVSLAYPQKTIPTGPQKEDNISNQPQPNRANSER